MYQQQQPTLYDRTTKLEETLKKFMQASSSNQKNHEASLRNLGAIGKAIGKPVGWTIFY